ncbi:ABC transporter substrate-binding protein [Halomicroarcula sp. F13]|uniref:ABC transporter substrate-binding protein n=1 Tax=Haloarcula rubra TaxID=2487747 RepID=A0AAW4PYF7_9EURY|nr:ABC transporter substrate-binding protein [Halomicroarcula rubra]MBX0325651.1 ABC transporter substrate-binding protein [Halomicroarcula rubra]
MTANRSRRKFIKGAGAATIAGLAGCTGDGGSDGSSGDGSSGDGSSGDGTTAGSTGSETVSLRFWHAMGGDLGKLIDSMVSDFASQADGIEMTATQKGSYRETLNATTSAVQAGNPPAIAQIFEIGTQLAIDSGVFAPVEDIIPSDVNFDNYLDSVLNYYRINGKLNSMPFNSSNAIFYYNKNAFEEAGLDPENPPTTFQGITDAANTLTEAGVVDKGTTWPNHSWFVEQWFAEQGQTLVNKKNGRTGRADKIHLESEASKNIFNWWADLYNQDQYLNPGIEAWSEAQQAFLTQKVGILGYSTSSIAPMKQGAKDNGFELGTMRLPTPGGQREGVVIGGASLWSPADISEAKKQAAGKFLAWLTKPEQQKRWHTNTGYFPVREEAISELENEGFYEENPNFTTAIEQLRETKDSPATRGALMGPFTQIRTMVEEGYVNMIQNENRSVTDVLNKVDSDAEDALASYNQKAN